MHLKSMNTFDILQFVMMHFRLWYVHGMVRELQAPMFEDLSDLPGSRYTYSFENWKALKEFQRTEQTLHTYILYVTHLLVIHLLKLSYRRSGKTKDLSAKDEARY
ncbi:unnamed protein product [Hermetia illucens]|uniref:Uncharacterized protein n=1 Tax=Hermetia illucens TaxID=343691 RepID=A0A7R8V789_HERIL|nr:unnamed protein product [Hermetia illucens]